MNRDAKTQSSLISLARSRRMQRALAHASIHRDAPMPSLRLSLGFMTSTARSAEGVVDAELGHCMTLLGVSRSEGTAYVVEEIGPDDSPIVYRLWLAGPRRGHLVPIHSWYEQCEDPAEIRARIASIDATLEHPPATTPEAWMLSTRVVQRRALRIGGQETPIRKFALQLKVEAVSGYGPAGHTTVTAFLRPDAELAEVWALPDGGGAIARVTYTGIPNGFGQPKDTVIYLSE